jgi:hypothetical protein
VNTRTRGRDLGLFMLCVLVVLGCSAPAVSAAVLLGRVDKWSPHGNASNKGWTSVTASVNLGSVEWGPPKKFRARNDKTVFSRQIRPSEDEFPGDDVSLSRNKFFRILGGYHSYVDIRWTWRGAESHRYRYIVSMRAIIAGG